MPNNIQVLGLEVSMFNESGQIIVMKKGLMLIAGNGCMRSRFGVLTRLYNNLTGYSTAW